MVQQDQTRTGSSMKENEQSGPKTSEAPAGGRFQTSVWKVGALEFRRQAILSRIKGWRGGWCTG